MVGRVIIVGSGENINTILDPYKSKLPIEYYHSEISGQIRQRKLGVSKLDNRTKLVATLDDDIILRPNALLEILEFWNTKDEITVGVGFNIENMSQHKYSKLKQIFYLSSKSPGYVLSSGYTTSLVNVESDIQTKWLNGGATLWLQEKLIQGIHKKSEDSIWSPCEDLIFSYPIGKNNKLWICKNAKVIHDDKLVYKSVSEAFQRGIILSKWTLNFVQQNPELSVLRFYIATFVSSSLNMVRKKLKYDFFFELGRLLFLFKIK